MSGVLRLDQTARLYHGGAEMAEAWLGGIRVWQVGPLAQYYGVGPGQIPMDLRFDAPAKMTVSNGRVTAVANDGGAGAAFNASAAEASAPTWDAAAQLVRFASPQAMALAQDANMAGVHALMALRLPASTVSQTTNLFMNAASTAGIQMFVPISGPRLRFLAPGFTHYPGSAPAALYGTWVLAEYRWADGAGTLIINGAVHSTQAGTVTDAPVNRVRGPYTTNGTSALGRCISIVCAAGHTATSPEPAVLAARQWLAERYGITLA